MQPKRDQDFFWEGIDQDKLLVRKCAQCGEMRHPPTPSCPHCLSMDWTAEEMAGGGTVYSWLISKHPNDVSGEGRVVMLVDLDEGIRVVANLEAGCSVNVGDRVRAGFAMINDQKLPVFRPA